ncbi:hypothetical protein [Sunxiuqinia dokdonensis]|uniref:hypothetical protein n=1 Tax=Sunxiuqinia dokdonensis TaxID=1409788 RepID=UPI0012FB8A12|nr:hypothetical protein [Sunxiuqinia dokdonensis]
MTRILLLLVSLGISTQLFSQGFATFTPYMGQTQNATQSESPSVKLESVVQYTSRGEWSKKYSVEVTFIHGSELNKATNSYNYSVTSNYGIIFWGENQASVIELSTPILSYGTRIDKENLRNMVIEIKGKDQEGREWKICTGRYCGLLN